jgi:hypothetical protein
MLAGRPLEDFLKFVQERAYSHEEAQAAIRVALEEAKVDLIRLAVIRLAERERVLRLEAGRLRAMVDSAIPPMDEEAPPA